MEKYCYHKSLDVLHLGCREPRAYFIPYADSDSARAGDREKSEYFTSLCGEWSFKYFESFEDVSPLFFAEDCDISELKKVTVPSCFQLYENGKYDNPLYSNLMYPFPTDPPHVPDMNPCGLYFRDIELDENVLRRDIMINFEGVSSCFYLYVNGSFVGYSQVSHSTSEFDIAQFLKVGANRITVLVVKWCDGSYLEDQDFFRLSGIFREVYLLARGRVRLDDIDIRQTFPLGIHKAVLKVKCTLSENTCLYYGLYSPTGEAVCLGVSELDCFDITVPKPLLWSDEAPYIYTLTIRIGSEVIPFELALREIIIKDKKLLLNGLPIKLKGVNRHDCSATGGYTVTLDEMRKDLLMIKRANGNCIRTSHYPNDPRFLLLAQSLGIYIVDEADLETHGMGYNTELDWDWTRWSQLSNAEQWKQAYFDRAVRLYERDKNIGCVIMWSLGNESGCGVNHRHMARYIRSRCPEALIHYENAHLEFKAVPQGENFSDISDVESRMYPSVSYTEQYLKDISHKKPFFLCEYVCSMSTGDVYDYWALVDKYDNFCGGCIWEWCDHAISFPAKDGSARYYYGGDFGDFPNNSISCLDGLVFPDRTPRPGFYDMKKVYEPFSGSYKNGILSITNKRYFTSLKDLSAKWVLASDSETLCSGIIGELDIPAECSESYILFDESVLKLSGNCMLTVSITQRLETAWAQHGYEVGFLQFELPARKKRSKSLTGKPIYKDDERYTEISSADCTYVFDRAYGKLCSVKRGKKELLAKPCEFSLWHAPTYNGGSAKAWQANHLDHVSQKLYSIKTELDGESTVEIKTKLALGGPANPPAVMLDADYVFLSDGSCEIKLYGEVRENLPPLPRFGILLTMKKENEDISYYGLGETETYPDRYRAARYGKYEKTVSENFIHHIRPQENSSHYKTRELTVGKRGGAGIFVTGGENGEFSFNASHYSDKQLTEARHDFELKPEPFTYVHIDGRMNAISENGELNTKENKRIFNDKSFYFSFRIQPTDFEE